MPALPREDLEHIFKHTENLWEDLRGSPVFMTGGTGFVGTWLLESLLWCNEKLNLGVTPVVLTRNPERFQGKSPHLANHPAVRILPGDVASFDFPEGEYPFIIHAATEPSIVPGYDHPLASFDADVEGTRRMLEFARTHGVKRFLFTSSGAVYGKQPSDLTHIPEDYLGAPLTTDSASAYGQAKRVSEFMCTMYGKVYGFDATIARLFAFVGPHLPLDANYAVGNFIRDVLDGRPVRIAGDGTPFRSYLYAADLTIWLWTILLWGGGGSAYNVGSSNDITIADLAFNVQKNTVPGTKIEVAKKAHPGMPAARYVPSTAKAAAELGLASWIGLEEGIKRMYQWYRMDV